MFVNVNAHPGSRPKALGELGVLSRERVILSEFKYARSTEIFGEAEPADFIYQVVDGAVRPLRLFPCPCLICIRSGLLVFGMATHALRGRLGYYGARRWHGAHP